MIFLVWGMSSFSFLGVLLGIILIRFSYNSPNKNMTYDDDLKAFTAYFESKYIFLYACRNSLQNDIKENLIPLFSIPFEEVYYDGPKFVQSFCVNKYVLENYLGSPKYLKLKSPALYQFQSGRLTVVLDIEPFIDHDTKIIKDLDSLKALLKEKGL